MSKGGSKYKMQEEELIVLSAFFLALPLPPVMAKNSKLDELSIEEVLQQTTGKLSEKKWIVVDKARAQRDWVIPELSELLRDIAYGNQMVHVYIHRQGEGARQIACYFNEGRVVYQQLSEDGKHILSQGEKDMGRRHAEELLHHAPKGNLGHKVQISIEAWNNLMASRMAEINDEILEALNSSENKADDSEVELRKYFAQDLLKATFIMELTCVNDRLSQKNEKVSFVVTEKSNWLVTASTSHSDQEVVWALEVPKQNLMKALAGIYASLRSNTNEK